MSFHRNATQPEPFFVRGGAPVDVPMMRKTDKNFGYARREGFTVVGLPYAGNELQFVVLLPDDINGLRELESKLSADVLASCAKLAKARRRSLSAKVQTRAANHYFGQTI